MTATYSSDIYVAEEHVKPTDVTAYVHIWNSAATISNPTSKIFKHRVDVSATMMSGSDSSASNVQTSKVITFSQSDAGEDFVLVWTCDVEGRTLSKWLLLRCSALPR